MANYSAIVKQGKMQMQTDFMRDRFKIFLKNHEGARIEFVPVVPESRKQRGMYHGAYIPLWSYLDGKDYRDSTVLDALHEIAKLEFNGDVLVVNNKPVKYGKSTAGKLNEGFMLRFLDFLIEQYGIDPSKVLDPNLYKKWKNEIWPFGGPETFIDYMRELKLL